MEKVLATVDRNKALEGACPFDSDDPFFIMVMQPSYILNSNLVSFLLEYTAFGL